MKTQYIIAQATVISATVLMLGTACSSHKTPANMKPAAQSLANAQSAVAGQSWEAPASIKGKTFVFAAPYSLRHYNNQSATKESICTTDSVAWKWSKKMEKETETDFGSARKWYEYKKTGARTAQLTHGFFEIYGGGARESENYVYKLAFDSPTSGTCSLEVSLWSKPYEVKYTATGRFTLK